MSLYEQIKLVLPLEKKSEVWLPADLSSERNSFSIGVPGANMAKENQIEIAGSAKQEELKKQLTISRQRTAEARILDIFDESKRSSSHGVDSSLFDRFTNLIKNSEEKKM